MKFILKSILAIASVSFSYLVTAQCTVTANPLTATITCGESVDIVAAGVADGPVLFEDFNSQSLGSGWSTTQSVNYNNPCGPSLDGTSSAWMGSSATQPRVLSTVGFDLQCGAEICFDLDFGADDACGGCTDCEDPDLFAEGVHFNYSTDGGSTWTEIFYFEATSGYANSYYQWDNYCFLLPAAGWSANTMFQWSQDLGSNVNFDHWGIDNVSIQPLCATDYYYEWDDGVSNVLGDNDTTITSIATTTTYDIMYTNGLDDTCTTSITVNVNPFDVDATASPINIDCGTCTDLDLVWLTTPNITGANYVYSWTPSTDLSDPNISNPEACPTDDITYTGTVTETVSGCVGSDAVLITVAGGGAISDFDVSPALQGCAPFSVDMVNNSTGTTYTWDFDDGSPTTTTFEPSHTYTVPGTYDIQLIAFLPGAGCINFDTSYVQVIVGNAIVPVADFDYTIDCGTTNIVLTQTGTGGLDYDWDMGDGTLYTGPNVTHDYGTTGQFTVTLTTGDATCGTQDIHVVVIDVVDNFITWTSNDPTCYQFSDGSITINTQFSNGGEVFSVKDSLGNELIVGGSNAANNLPDGTYYVNVDLGLGCADSTIIIINHPDEILVDLGLTHVACNGDATGIAEVIGGSGGVAPMSYFWNPDPGNQSGLGADSTGSMTAGNYVLQVNDDNGCSNTFDFEITEPTALEFTQLGSDAAFCRLEDYQSGNGVVYAAAGGGTPDYDYVWLNLQDSSATSFTTWGGLNPGQYEITVYDNNGCILVQEITVDEAFPIADFTMTSPEFDFEFGGTAPVSVHFINESQFFANPNNPNADTTFFWNFNFDNSSWVISHDLDETFDTTYTVGGTYEVCLVAINKNGCTDTLCKDIIIYDPPLFQPVNIFTPNGDGDNDEFTFLSVSQAISEFKCTVVDRWGVVMIEFDDITDTWDGTDKSGSECNDGVYFYTYHAVADNSEVIEGQGNVTIIRGK